MTPQYQCQIYVVLEKNAERGVKPRNLRQLAARTGLSIPALRALADGKSQPHLATAHSIARAVGYSLRTLWPSEQFMGEP